MNDPMARLASLRREAELRERELLRLYRPSDQQEQVHLTKASEILIIGGKRSGKSVSAAVNFASRVLGEPIYGIDGTPLPKVWPSPSPDYPRLFWVIGWDLRHIGQTIHKLLFLPGMGGQFRCVQDEVTGKWRTWNRADPKDVKRIKESKLTEPLIPERMIVPDSWSWEDKRSNQFNSVDLVNGAKIFAFPSTARNPKQGDAVSGIWIDEDIVYPEHLKEWQDRLTDENGWMQWSAWPHQKNGALLELLERAELAAIQENPRIEKVQLVMTENPHITAEGKSQALERMGSDDEIARRNRGDVNMDSLSMYPFDAQTHSLKPKLIGAIYERERTDAYKALRSTWEVKKYFPKEWTRYFIMDPSHTRTGIISVAVPPPYVEGVFVGDVMLIEWEIVAKRMTADTIAYVSAQKREGFQYESHIIDMRAGRQTHAGRDTNTTMHFSDAFRKHRLVSRQTSYGFAPGCDIPSTRYRAVRNLMEIQPGSGIPSLMIVEETCPATKTEFTKYRKKKASSMVGADNDNVLDEPANPRVYDLMAAVEYAAAYLEPLFIVGKAYVEPSNFVNKGSGAYHAAMQWKKKQESKGGSVVLLGAGT